MRGPQRALHDKKTYTENLKQFKEHTAIHQFLLPLWHRNWGLIPSESSAVWRLPFRPMGYILCTGYSVHGVTATWTGFQLSSVGAPNLNWFWRNPNYWNYKIDFMIFLDYSKNFIHIHRKFTIFIPIYILYKITYIITTNYKLVILV